MTKHGGRGGYQHHSPLDKKLAEGSRNQQVFINTFAEQETILKKSRAIACYTVKIWDH